MPQAPKLSPVKLVSNVSPKKAKSAGLKSTPPFLLKFTDDVPQTASHPKASICVCHLEPI